MAEHDRRTGGVVTPEAVPLEFRAAGIGSRCVALLIDLMVQSAIVFALTIAGALVAAVGVVEGMPPWAAGTLVVLLVSAVVWGYPTGFETLWRGRTPGKAAMGLRVVTREGAPVRFRHAAIRAALGFVDFLLTFGAAAVLSALATRQHQRLGDLVAGTIVLRERSAGPTPQAVRFRVPPGGEAYAATLDPAVLGPADYQAVRTFLLRAPGLRPPVRAAVARRLAEPLAARLRHRPPANVSPWMFLLCLAARYQERAAPVTGPVSDAFTAVRAVPAVPAPPPSAAPAAPDRASAGPPLPPPPG